MKFKTGTMNTAMKNFYVIYPDPKLKQLVISPWVKEENKWWEQWKRSQHIQGAQDAKCAHQMEHPGVSKMMEFWVLQAYRGCPLSQVDFVCQLCRDPT